MYRLSSNTRRVLATQLAAAILCTSPAMLIPSRARAQEGKIEMAQQLAADGDKAFAAKNYKLSLRKYRAAYELVPHGVLLYNVSRSHALLGEYIEALQTAQQVKMLGDELPQEVVVKNDAYINSYMVLISAQNTGKDIRVRLDEAADAKPKDESKGLTALGWSGVGAAGVGGALLITSLILNIQIGPEIDAFEIDKQRVEDGELDRNEADLNNRADSLQGKQTTGLILLFSGGVLIATGAVLLALDLLSTPEENKENASLLHSPRLLGGPTPDGFALGLSFDF